MAAKKGNPAFAFVTDYLTKKPGAPFAEVAEKAAAKGHKIYPINFGRAQLLLGHVKAGGAKKKAKKAKAKKAKAAAKKTAAKAAVVAEKAAPKNGRRKKAAPKNGRRKKAGRRKGAKRSVGAAPSSGSLDAVVNHVRAIERERDQLRGVLSRISSLLDSLA